MSQVPKVVMQRSESKDSQSVQSKQSGSVTSSFAKGVRGIMAGYEKLSKTAAEIVSAAASGIKDTVIRYMLPTEVDTYDMNSDLFQQEIGETAAHHRTNVNTWDDVQEDFKTTMTRFEEQATELAHAIDHEERINHELQKAAAVHKMKKKTLVKRKETIDNQAAEAIAEHQQRKQKYLISFDRINGKIKTYAMLTCAQVQEMENLDDPTVWETMTVRDCKTKFNRLEGQGWHESSDCPVQDVQKDRLHSNESVESKESYIGRLKEFVGYSDPEPEPEDTHEGLVEAPVVDFPGQPMDDNPEDLIRRLVQKIGKRKLDDILVSIPEGNEQAEGSNDSEQGRKKRPRKEDS